MNNKMNNCKECVWSVLVRGYRKEGMEGDPAPQTSVQSQRLSSVVSTMESETPPKLLHLPYVKGVSERIEKMCRPLGVKT